MSLARSWAAIYECGGLYAVRVIFSDETGLGSKREEPLCVVAALMMNVDSQWDPLHSDCSRSWALLKKRLKAKELKGRELLKRLRRKKDSEVAFVLRSLMTALVTHKVPVFYEAVDRASFEISTIRTIPLSYIRDVSTIAFVYPRGSGAPKSCILADPYSVAFGLCVGQIDRHLHAVVPREKILWISDHSPHYQNELKLSARRHQYGVAIQKELERRGILNSPGHSPASHLVDTIYFGDSKESLMLQLADVCCSVIAAHLLGQTVAEPYYEILRSAIVTERTVVKPE